jgi:hypothetical protein
MTVRLNIDLGELADEPPALASLAQLVNVACGAHAGDEASARSVVRRAAACGAALRARRASGRRRRRRPAARRRAGPDPLFHPVRQLRQTRIDVEVVTGEGGQIECRSGPVLPWRHQFRSAQFVVVGHHRVNWAGHLRLGRTLVARHGLQSAQCRQECRSELFVVKKFRIDTRDSADHVQQVRV